jgi:hypothetical protein
MLALYVGEMAVTNWTLMWALRTNQSKDPFCHHNLDLPRVSVILWDWKPLECQKSFNTKKIQWPKRLGCKILLIWKPK